MSAVIINCSNFFCARFGRFSASVTARRTACGAAFQGGVESVMLKGAALSGYTAAMVWIKNVNKPYIAAR